VTLSAVLDAASLGPHASATDPGARDGGSGWAPAVDAAPAPAPAPSPAPASPPPPPGALDASHLVVLDGIYTEGERRGMIEWLTGLPWGTDPGDADVPAAARWTPADGPPGRWARGAVADLAGGLRGGDDDGAAGWGLSAAALAELASPAPPPWMVSMQTRLSAVYPEFVVCLMPGDAMEPGGDDGVAYDDDDDDGADDAGSRGGRRLRLTSHVANWVASSAAAYDWHLDMDPSCLDPWDGSPWAVHHGRYRNRDPRRPLLVSVLAYPQRDWPEGWAADTHFLDPGSRSGLVVRPCPYRLVVCDQDVPHRVGAPSAPGCADEPGRRPEGRGRLSLVWKAALLPRAPRRDGGGWTLARPQWGPPLRLGTAGVAPHPCRGWEGLEMALGEGGW